MGQVQRKVWTVKFGQRIFPDKFGQLRLPEGGYGKNLRGKWFVRPPGQDMGDLDGHTVVEHADGSITVDPSIDGGGGHWMLERGIWREL
jgi:hypothetical protein